MNNKILFLSVVTSALLAACGGGGGDKNSTATSSGGNSGSQTTAPSNTFTVKAQYKDACGNVAPAPNASLLVHDAEFNTEQVVNADANGVISYSSQSATKNLSILIPGQTALANGVTPVTLSTYIDQPLSDLGEYSALTFNDSQCECKTISEVIVSA